MCNSGEDIVVEWATLLFDRLRDKEFASERNQQRQHRNWKYCHWARFRHQRRLRSPSQKEKEENYQKNCQEKSEKIVERKRRGSSQWERVEQHVDDQIRAVLVYCAHRGHPDATTLLLFWKARLWLARVRRRKLRNLQRRWYQQKQVNGNTVPLRTGSKLVV